MDWPRTPVERLRRFRPPFCPHRDCPEHNRERPGFRFRPNGSYVTKHRRVLRFVCNTCGGSCSTQSFATSYFLKRPELLTRIADQWVNGSCDRQIARTLGCAHSTVARQLARIGRHAMLFKALARQELKGQLREPVVLDHFETFEFSQDLPFGLATPVGSASWFVYGTDLIPHRRTGRRSPAQQVRLDSRPQRPDRGGYRGSARRILEMLAGLAGPGMLQVIGDGHPAYEQARRDHPHRDRIVLARYPNPPRGPKGSRRSPQARARDRAMFPVDALHALIRHSLSHQRRETIAFGRRLNAAAERISAFLVWRNFVKPRSERTPDPETPAMRVGLAAEPWSWRWLLSRRLFPDRIPLPDPWNELYRRDWTTPVLPSNTRHRLRYAF